MHDRFGKADKRGNSRDRRIRKLWMLAAYGDGQACACVHCGITVTYSTVEADRIQPGGSYRRSNVQPSCRKCNVARGKNTRWVGPNPQVQTRVDVTIAINPLFLPRGALA